MQVLCRRHADDDPLLSVTLAEGSQPLSSASGESRLVVGHRFNELVVEAGHPAVVVAVFLADL
jgi:hypothetical protein